MHLKSFTIPVLDSETVRNAAHCCSSKTFSKTAMLAKMLLAELNKSNLENTKGS